MSDTGLNDPAVAVAAGDEHILARLLDELPDAVIVISARDGLLQWANRTAGLLFGHSVSAAIGTTGLDLVHPDDLELALRSLVSVQDKHVGTPIEIRLKTTTGWRLMELIGSPVTWLEEGSVLLAIRDLTQRRRFELVHNHDARLRSLVQNSAAITMLISPDGCVQSVSGALTRLLGQDPEVVEGRPLAELVDPADHQELDNAFERASRGASVAGPVTISLDLVRHGNTGTLPFELAIVNLIDDPTVGGYVVTGHDVTDRRTADLEIRKALSLLTATLDATADGILVVDNDGQIINFNQRLTDMWSVPDGILASGDHGKVAAYVRDQLVRPEQFVNRVTEQVGEPDWVDPELLEFKDGRIFARVSKPQTVDGETVGRVWSYRDVTDRRPRRRSSVGITSLRP